MDDIRPPYEVLGKVLGPEVAQLLRYELHKLPRVAFALKLHAAGLAVEGVPAAEVQVDIFS